MTQSGISRNDSASGGEEAPEDISGPNDNSNTYIDNSSVDVADLERWKLEMCEVGQVAVKAASKAPRAIAAGAPWNWEGRTVARK